jgi:hypothetical protein
MKTITRKRKSTEKGQSLISQSRTKAEKKNATKPDADEMIAKLEPVASQGNSARGSYSCPKICGPFSSHTAQHHDKEVIALCARALEDVKTFKKVLLEEVTKRVIAKKNSKIDEDEVGFIFVQPPNLSKQHWSSMKGKDLLECCPGRNFAALLIHKESRNEIIFHQLLGTEVFLWAKYLSEARGEICIEGATKIPESILLKVKERQSQSIDLTKLETNSIENDAEKPAAKKRPRVEYDSHFLADQVPNLANRPPLPPSYDPDFVYLAVPRRIVENVYIYMLRELDHAQPSPDSPATAWPPKPLSPLLTENWKDEFKRISKSQSPFREEFESPHFEKKEIDAKSAATDLFLSDEDEGEEGEEEE